MNGVCDINVFSPCSAVLRLELSSSRSGRGGRLSPSNAAELRRARSLCLALSCCCNRRSAAGNTCTLSM
eukprot:31559-Pelagococcus_subviridis.AAC.4